MSLIFWWKVCWKRWISGRKGNCKYRSWTTWSEYIVLNRSAVELVETVEEAVLVDAFCEIVFTLLLFGQVENKRLVTDHQFRDAVFTFPRTNEWPFRVVVRVVVRFHLVELKSLFHFLTSRILDPVLKFWKFLLVVFLDEFYQVSEKILVVEYVENLLLTFFLERRFVVFQRLYLINLLVL